VIWPDLSVSLRMLRLGQQQLTTWVCNARLDGPPTRIQPLRPSLRECIHPAKSIVQRIPAVRRVPRRCVVMSHCSGKIPHPQMRHEHGRGTGTSREATQATLVKGLFWPSSPGVWPCPLLHSWPTKEASCASLHHIATRTAGKLHQSSAIKLASRNPKSL